MASNKTTPKKAAPKKVALKKPVVRRSSQAAAKKPIISLATLVMIVIFAGVILLWIFINRQKETSAAQATPTKGSAFIFPASEGSPSSIEVAPNTGSAVKLVRDEKGIWAFELPAKAEADQGLVQAALSQISALQVVDTLPADANPSIFGFDKSAYVITLKFGDKTRALEIGDATPTNSGYYVRVDKGRIMIADLSGVDALTKLVTSPPYMNTPTPEANITPTP